MGLNGIVIYVGSGATDTEVASLGATVGMGGVIVLDDTTSSLPTLYTTNPNTISKEELEMMDDIIDDDKDIEIEIHKENKHCFQRQTIKHVKRSRTKHKKPHMTRRII